MNRLLVTIIGALIILPWLGSKSFYTRGEPREALVIQEMVREGAWILPRGYSEDVPSKPPFMHWIGGVASLVTGEVSEFTTRLPSALAALCFLWAFYGLVERRRGRSEAIAAAVLLFLSVEWTRAAVTTRVDMMLATLMAGALLALYRWEERGCRGYPAAALALLTAATLTKGPVSVVLPTGIFGAYLLLRRHRLGAVIVRPLVVTVPALALAAFWYGAAWWEGGSDFVERVLYENVARFSGTMEDSPHNHSAAYLVGTLLLGFMPWTVMLAAGVEREWWSRIRRWRPLEWSRTAEPLQLFAGVAVMLVVIFFSIPESKRSVYLLPAYPFVAILLAPLVVSLSARPRYWSAVRRVFGGVLLSGALGMLALSQSWIEPGLFVRRPEKLFDLMYVTAQFGTAPGVTGLCLLGLVGVSLLTGPRRWPGFGVVAAGVASVIVILNAVLLPLYTEPLSPRRLAEDVAPLLGADDRLYSWGTEFYGVSFYLHREIFRLAEVPAPGSVIFVLARLRGELEATLPPGQELELLFRSPYGVVKPRDQVEVLRITGR